MTATFKGELTTKLVSIIPFLLFLTASRVSNHGKLTGMALALHVTPFLSLGITVPKFLLRRPALQG